MALGLVYLMEAVRGYRPEETPRRLQAAGRLLTRVPWDRAAVILPIVALAINFSYADMSSDRQVRDQYTSVLTSLEADALVLGWWPDTAPMGYLQHVDGMRRDVQLVDRFLITPENEVRLLDSVRSQRPVYVFGYLPSLSSPYEIEPFWHGYKIVAPSALR